MKNGFIFQSLRSIFARDLYTCMLAIAIAGLLVLSPLTYAGSKEKTAEQAKPAMVASKVNINKASADTIAEVLSGIGKKKAEAIVAYRKVHGDFKSVEDLLAVKGVGEATLEKNKGKIVL